MEQNLPPNGCIDLSSLVIQRFAVKYNFIVTFTKALFICQL